MNRANVAWSQARTTLPVWILCWFIFTVILCTSDACFILLRPHSFPGGKLHYVFWYPYRTYMHVDQRYEDVSDGFVVAISLMNCAEVVFNLATLFLHKRRSGHTVPLGFTVSVMTFWKTIMYFLMLAEICGGHNFRKGNELWEEILIIAIPNGIWIVVPFVVMAALWNQMMVGSEDEATWVTTPANNNKRLSASLFGGGGHTRRHTNGVAFKEQ